VSAGGLTFSAMVMACSSLSMAQGPAMIVRWPLPMVTAPTWIKVSSGLVSRLTSL
jgi:hypothetical protein